MLETFAWLFLAFCVAYVVVTLLAYWSGKLMLKYLEVRVKKEFRSWAEKRSKDISAQLGNGVRCDAFSATDGTGQEFVVSWMVPGGQVGYVLQLDLEIFINRSQDEEVDRFIKKIIAKMGSEQQWNM